MRISLASSSLAVFALFSMSRDISAQAKALNVDSGIVYETITRTMVEGMPFGSGMERTRTIDTPRGTRTEVLERSGSAASMGTANPVAGKLGTYRLSLDSGRRLIVVDTIAREYFELRFGDDNMEARMSKMLSSMNLKTSGMKSDSTDLGNGGRILGHVTRHWKVHELTTTSMSNEGDTASMTADILTDKWYATGARSIVPRTLPLKQISKGKVGLGPMLMLMSTTTDVTRLESGTFGASLFQVPRSYKRVSAPYPFSSIEQSPDKLF